MTQAPATEIDRNPTAVKLAQATLVADAWMQDFRARRKEFLEHLAGPYYGKPGFKWAQPLNIIYSIASTIEPALSVRRIRSSVRNTEVPYWFCDRYRAVIDRTLDRLRAATAMRDAIRESLYAMGILKTATRENGAIYCEPISFEHYILDAKCRGRRPGGYRFEGHHFDMPLEWAMDSGIFAGQDRKEVERLKEEGPAASESAETISGTRVVSSDDYEPKIRLVELFLPDRDDPENQRVVWLAGRLNEATRFLRDVPWHGHEDGPYDVLGYCYIPDNAIPLSIIAVIFGLCLLENALADKSAEQAKGQKDVVVGKIDTNFTSALRDAMDGAYLGAADPDAVKVVSTGGINEKNYAAMGYFLDWINRLSRNTDLTGGLRAASRTLGQDQLLFSQASIGINDMREAVLEAARSVVRKVAWYLWRDKGLTVNLHQRIPGGIELPGAWEPSVRHGDFDDYTFDVASYPKGSDSPEERYQRLRDLVTSFVVPLAPMAAQTGSYPNADVIVNAAGRELDIPEIEELWIEGEPAGTAGGGTPSAPRAGTPPKPVLPVTRLAKAPSPIEEMAVAAVQQGNQP